MSFRFPLTPLLRLQQSLEKQEEQRLLALASVVEELRRRIEALDEGQTQKIRVGLRELADGATGAELHFAVLGDQVSAEKRKQLVSEWTLAERRKQEQMKIYRDIRRKRETLASLRKDHQEMKLAHKNNGK